MNISQKRSLSNFAIGPAGRAMAQPMEPDLLEAILQHITMERNANVQYFSISLWFLERELRGFSSFYSKEAIDELSHAQKFSEYIIARGQQVSLFQLDQPLQEWDSIEDIFKTSFQMEADVTTSMQQIYSIAERSSDTRTTVFMDPQIESQINSEDTFAYLLGRVKIAGNDPASQLIIDGELSLK